MFTEERSELILFPSFAGLLTTQIHYGILLITYEQLLYSNKHCC